MVEDFSGSSEQGIAAVDGFGGALDHGVAEGCQFSLIQGEPAFPRGGVLSGIIAGGSACGYRGGVCRDKLVPE